MRKRTLLILTLLLALAVVFWPRTATQQTPAPMPPGAQSAPAIIHAPPSSPMVDAMPSFLPREARDMVAVIQRGGPFGHRQDGNAFGNREGLLPQKQHGYYREFTVDTPGVNHRGARRIVTGGSPPQVWYYTDDHYDSFHAFDVSGLERSNE